MKIVAITDKPGSAIDRLANMNADRLQHMQYIVCPLHPKRPEPAQIEKLKNAIIGADLIHVEYWKSGMKARELMPEILEIPTVLTHHNEHNINDTAKDHWPWKDQQWAAHVCKNQWQKGELQKNGIDAKLIPHAIEFSNFSYADSLPENKTTLKPVVGYVGQIKKVKGVRYIAQACKDLGYCLMLVGSVSEAEYWAELQRDFAGTLYLKIPGTLSLPDNMIGEAYHRMNVFCANSDDGTESGTMPILEAMASGIPVVTRRFGLVRDCGKHAVNMYIRAGRYDDVEDLKSALKMVVENIDISNDMREAAWRTVRQYHPDRQAREYEILFRKVLFPRTPMVSIIMPTCDRNDIIAKNIAVIAEQTYKNIELVICDDNNIAMNVNGAVLYEAIKEIRKDVRFPIKVVSTYKTVNTYGLAKARNVGVVESTGDILVFCDDRLAMHPGAIESFVTELVKKQSVDRNKKVWVWGSKGKFKTFVENFSATWRRTFIDAGMFNERVNRYGGMTQEISSRFGTQGFKFEFCPQALCEPLIGTHSKSRHRDDIIASKVQLYKLGFQ